MNDPIVRVRLHHKARARTLPSFDPVCVCWFQDRITEAKGDSQCNPHGVFGLDESSYCSASSPLFWAPRARCGHRPKKRN